jgi:hypothetical protein
MTYAEYTKSLSFIDRLYHFYFFEYRKQVLLFLCIFVIAISYIVITVFMLGRNEDKALNEAIIFTIIACVTVPMAYCSTLNVKNKRNTNDRVIFNALLYRKTNSKLIKWQNVPRNRSHKKESYKVRYRNVIYRTDTTMYSNILRD